MNKVILTGFLMIFVGICQELNAQCTQWTNPSPLGVYGTFNNPPFYGAPCDDGDGCQMHEITAYEVWAGDAYRINDFEAGATYTFSMCNGPNAGTWIPEFTILDPVGVVEKFGAGDGDGCSITWTAQKSGKYIVIINSAGNCGNGPYLETNNGYPSLTCTDGSVLCSTEIDTVCEAGTLESNLTTFLCPGNEGNVTTLNPNVPTNGGFQWVFEPGEDASGGTAPDGFSLPATSIYDFTFDNNLNGALANSGYEPLSGTWSVYGRVGTDYADIGNTTCDTTKKRSFVFLDSLAAPCLDACDTVNIEVTLDVINESIMGANDGKVTATVSGGNGEISYLWDYQNKRTPTISNLSPGRYCVTVYDENLCAANDDAICDSVRIGISPCDTTDIIIEYEVTNESVSGANDGAIDITVTGGLEDYTFDWSNGAETQDIENLSPNLYSVTVTDKNGCKETDHINVYSNPVGVKSLSNISELKIYPNPLQEDFLNVYVSAAKRQKYQISIWSITGSLISYQERVIDENSQFQIDCSKLETGNYLFKIAGKEETGVLKFQILK